jgi:eukaryotic-like serine/threonine-protein kinase
VFKIITQRPLWLNILSGLVLALGIFFLFILSLRWITHHGSSLTVPSVAGKQINEASSILKKSGFDFEVEDSVYVDTVPPLTVIRQIPEADEVVKSNRKIELLISMAVAPEVQMPNLVGYSFRNAEMVLKNLGLKLGDTTFKTDFAKYAVLEQLVGGNSIVPGARIKMGTRVSLVLGNGVGNRDMLVPVITGMQFCDAKEVIEGQGLALGSVLGFNNENITDTCHAYVVRQNPEHFDDFKKEQYIRSGQTIDVWLQTTKPAMDTSSAPDNHLPNQKPD